MYKSFFGLKDNPFNVNPDPRFLYFTKEIEEAFSGLKYGIQNRKGFITLTGEVGNRQDDAGESVARLVA